MTDHLAEAKRLARSAASADISVEWAQVTATLATAHVFIAIAERLLSPAEPPSAQVARVREADRLRAEEEDKNGI